MGKLVGLLGSVGMGLLLGSGVLACGAASSDEEKDFADGRDGEPSSPGDRGDSASPAPGEPGSPGDPGDPDPDGRTPNTSAPALPIPAQGTRGGRTPSVVVDSDAGKVLVVAVDVDAGPRLALYRCDFDGKTARIPTSRPR